MAFLAYYAFRSFRAVLKTESLTVAPDKKNLPSLRASLTTALALSLLNPHVYLDTVVLLGSIGAQFPVFERPYFALGAILASFIWFFSMGYGARFLAPLFRKPLSWKILDFIIGCIMTILALTLAFGMKDLTCQGSGLFKDSNLADQNFRQGIKEMVVGC